MSDVSLIDADGTVRFQGTMVGGGGAPAGSDGEIQFNDSDAFGASPDLVYDVAGKVLKLNADVEGTAAIETIGAGAQLVISASDAAAGNTGGEMSISSGAGDGGNGGDLTIQAGDDLADGSGGSVTIASGTSDADNGFNGGDIDIRANPTHIAGFHGGNIRIIAGEGAVSGGGGVLIQGGATSGNVQIYSGDSNQLVQLDSNGLHVNTTKIGFYSTAPIVQQTGVAVDAAAIHAALVALGLITA